MADFSSLGLSDWLVKQCKQLGINKPTPVQENCMPAILRGENMFTLQVEKCFSRLTIALSLLRVLTSDTDLP